MEDLTNRYDIVLRRVDIVSWDSAVARQHGIDRLPTLWLYEDGVRIATDPREIVQRITQGPMRR